MFLLAILCPLLYLKMFIAYMGGQNNIFWGKYFLGWPKNIFEKIYFFRKIFFRQLRIYYFFKNIFSVNEKIFFNIKYFFRNREYIFWKNSIFSKVVKIFFGIFLFFCSKSSADKPVRIHVQDFHFIFVQTLFWYLWMRKIFLV